MTTTANGKKCKRIRRGPPKFPGIVQDAGMLGVTRQHLFAVLTHRRVSHRLLAAYTNLKATSE